MVFLKVHSGGFATLAGSLHDTFFFWIIFVFIIGGADVCISVNNSSENKTLQNTKSDFLTSA